MYSEQNQKMSLLEKVKNSTKQGNEHIISLLCILIT